VSISSYVALASLQIRADPGILKRGARRWVWGPPPENFEKLDAISYNLVYIFGSEWHRISFNIKPLQNKETVGATIAIYTRAHTPPPFQKLLSFPPLQNLNSISKICFSAIVYNVKK